MVGFEDFLSGIVVIENINVVTKGKETLRIERWLAKVWIS